MKIKLKKLWGWLKKEILNKNMILWLIIAELIFWSPVIVFAVLAVIMNPWFWSLALTVIVFWAGPLTPAVPLQLGLAYGLKKIFQRKKDKKQKDGKQADEKSEVE